MRNFAAFIGVAIGAYIGWLFGSLADGYYAWVVEGHAGHTYTFVMPLVMASAAGYSFGRVATQLVARTAAAESKAERVALRLERTRPRTGRTPPAPFPALQA